MGPPVRSRRASISSRLRLTLESYREQKTEVRSQKTEVGGRRSEVGGPKSEVASCRPHCLPSGLCPLPSVLCKLPSDAIVFERGRPRGFPVAATGSGRSRQLPDLSEWGLLQPLQRASH